MESLAVAAPAPHTAKNINQRGLTPLGYKIYLDRYALTNPQREPQPGDVVVVRSDEGARWGVVEHWDSVMERVHLSDHTDCARSLVDVKDEVDPAQTWDRVSAWAGTDDAQRARFRCLLEDWQFIPGGRITHAAGNPYARATCSNCFILPSPHDSREGIFRNLFYVSETMSKGGGVGVTYSTLRPRGALCLTVGGRASGPVSWGSHLLSPIAPLTEQGGTRRGAIMFALHVWHPDVIEFIEAKRTPGVLEGTNVSVLITDDFMAAVEADGPWDLVFPDTRHPDYDTCWNGNLRAWKDGGRPIKVYKTMRARELWNMIIESAHASAEPGIIFHDRILLDSNSYFYPQGHIVGTNPCAEQPNPGWSACNLGHLYVAKFVRWIDPGEDPTHCVDWLRLKTATGCAVEFLDRVLEAQHYPLPQYREQQLLERRIGLGTLGLGEALVKVGLKYGSPKSIDFIQHLYRAIRDYAYEASCDLAEELGPFPAWESKMADSGFCRRLPDTLLERVRTTGTRNVTLLTQAPTGTGSTMINTSGGIEPFYALSWDREGLFGKAEEKAPIMEAYRAHYGEDPDPKDPRFATAMGLTPEEHVAVQAAVQEFVDASISKTVNMPEKATVEEVGRIYQLLYASGCKGGTVYRDKSRNKQVLSLKENKPAATPKPAKVRPHPRSRTGVTLTVNAPGGKVHVTINEDSEGRPCEVFLRQGRAGSDVNALSEALGKMISLALRIPSELPAAQVMREVHRRLRGIRGADVIGFGREQVGSLPDAVAKAIEDHYFPVKADTNGHATNGTHTKSLAGATRPGFDICPACGNAKLIHQDGCETCLGCSWTKCG